jgi:2,4-dienoyl-CoA reductase-like NADH-dependent reductase (Old Yellow Enzyme family)
LERSQVHRPCSRGAWEAVTDLDELIRRLDREEFDLVAVGRALLQDPQWLLKIRDGRTDELMAFERTAFAALS